MEYFPKPFKLYLRAFQNRGWTTQSPLFAPAHKEISKAFVLQTDSENAKKITEQFTQL
ncbi:MAG: hypothetical protein AAB336_04955 [Acidobacteriota bacterium]